MIDKTETFTFTLLYRDEDEKVIFIKHGETPAKSEDEADSVLSSLNEDEKETVEKIMAKLFKDAEEGSEESISASLQEFEDRYDISLEELEDEVGEDLDNDNEEEEVVDHVEKVLDSEDDKSEEAEDESEEAEEEAEEDEEEVEEESPEKNSKDSEESDLSKLDGPAILKKLLSDPTKSISIITVSDMTDPTNVIPASYNSNYTNPIAYLDEALPEETEEEEDELEEGAQIQDLISRFISKARNLGPLLKEQVTEIFNSLHVTDTNAKLAALKAAWNSGNVSFFRNAEGEPLLAASKNLSILPPGVKEIGSGDIHNVKQAISEFAGSVF